MLMNNPNTKFADTISKVDCSIIQEDAGDIHQCIEEKLRIICHN